MSIINPEKLSGAAPTDKKELKTPPQQEVVTQEEYKFPTEVVDLPSGGKLYPEEHPLRSGQVEIKYMTAKEEDILTTESYIRKGIVFDKFFQSLMLDAKLYPDLLITDRDALMVAARSHAYGNIYKFTALTPSGNEQEVQVDLDDLQFKQLPEDVVENKFKLVLPVSKREIEFKLLTVGDRQKVVAHTQKFKGTSELLKSYETMILNVDGETSRGKISKFVNEEFLAGDTSALRAEIRRVSPGIDTEVEVEDELSGESFRTNVDFRGIRFLWPDTEL